MLLSPLVALLTTSPMTPQDAESGATETAAFIGVVESASAD